MKRLLIAFAVVGSLYASAAYAADQPAGAPSAAEFNWSGFYLGPHVGYGWSHSSSETFRTDTGASVGTSSNNSNSARGGIQLGNDFMLTPNILFGAIAVWVFYLSFKDRPILKRKPRG